MINIEYTFEQTELAKLDHIDLASASATQLNYYLFCGNVKIRFDSARFDAEWGWVPIFDFATQLLDISRSILDGMDKVLEFTESDAEINFHRTGKTIEVSASYSEGAASVLLDEFQREALGFFVRVVNDLLTRWPKLAENPAFKSRTVSLEQ